MSGDERTRRLSADEIATLTFAGRRQLTRWSNRRELSPRERERRATLTFADGCELRAATNDA